MTKVIELRSLVKTFEMETVLKGVDLQLHEHSVLGLLGVNGAGKTTLLRCALGLLKPAGGEALVYGQNAWNLSPEIKKRIGFVPQIPDLFQWMTAEQMLNYTAAFYDNWSKTDSLNKLAKWDLTKNMRIGKMSEGQKQRLAIVLAMGHDPDLLVLDEPVAALDPVARRDFIRQLLELNADRGKTILFSTHIVSDLERLAAEVAIVRDGRVYYQGEIDSLKEKIVRLKIYSRDRLPLAFNFSNTLSSTISGNTATVCIQEFNPVFVDQLKRDLNVDIEVQYLGLEDIFLEINRT